MQEPPKQFSRKSQTRSGVLVYSINARWKTVVPAKRFVFMRNVENQWPQPMDSKENCGDHWPQANVFHEDSGNKMAPPQ
jgi:hypothetical protein